MKRFSKPIGQCLTTALVTSALLEMYAAPLLGAPTEPDSPDPVAPAATPAPSVTPEMVVAPAAVAAPTATAPEAIVAPAEAASAAPAVSPVAPAALSQPSAPAAASPQPALVPPATFSPKPVAQAGSAIKPTVAQTNAQSAPADADEATLRLQAARQVLAERLAAIVAQDQSDRQAQLQQNLAAAALHYAESGAFEQAVQIAQHAALPPELQAEILAEINTIAAEQTGQSQIAGQPAAVIQATLDTVATPSGLAVAPEQAQPQFSSARWRAQPDSTTWRYCPATPQPAAAPEARAIAAATDPKPARSMLKLGAAANLPSIAPATVQTLQSVERSVREKQFEFKLALRVDAPSATPIAAAQVAPQSMRSSSLNGVIAAQSVAVPALQVAAPEVMPPQTQQPTIHATSSRIVQAAIQAADAPAPITEGRLPTAAIVTQMLNQLSQAELPTTIAAITAPKAANKTIAPTATAALPEASRSSNSSGSPCTPARGRSVWSRLNQLNLRLPLPVPAVITSVFGWRTHPITGDQRFHAGIDIGAPMGTPVLAARSGQVVVADRMGGYGITVMLEDETASVRNLYAHLSGIAVQPGAWVEQGTVIGWVGSTGNSTGPHLHFETRQRTAEGWIAVDPIDAELAIPADRVAQANRE